MGIEDHEPHNMASIGALSLEQRLARYERVQEDTLAIVRRIEERMSRGSERHRNMEAALEGKANLAAVTELRGDFEHHRDRVESSVAWAIRLVVGTVITAVVMGALGLAALGAVAYVNHQQAATPHER